MGQAQASVHTTNENEENLDPTDSLFRHNGRIRPLLYRTLARCSQGDASLGELEEMIAQQPEFKEAEQAPYFIVKWLADAGAVEELLLDANGNPLGRDALSGLSEDEIDDIAVGYAYRITERGKRALLDYSPKAKVDQLIEQAPEKAPAYRALLGFLKEPKSLAEIESFLCGEGFLPAHRAPGEELVNPALYVDKLSAAGAISFDGGWCVTQEGREFLSK